MQSGSDSLVSNLNTISEISESVQEEAEIIGSIAEMNIQVATACEQQAAVAVEISRNASMIYESASSSSGQVMALSEMGKELGGYSDELRGIVESYRV